MKAEMRLGDTWINGPQSFTVISVCDDDQVEVRWHDKKVNRIHRFQDYMGDWKLDEAAKIKRILENYEV